MSSEPNTSGPDIRACTVSRNIEGFDLLIDEMEDCLGEAWGDLMFHEVSAFLTQPDGQALEFLVIATDDQDAPKTVASAIQSAKAHNIKVILAAKDLSASDLHALMRVGADDFIPYPPPTGELARAIDAVSTKAEPPAEPPQPDEPEVEVAEARHPPAPRRAASDPDGVVLTVQGLSGGTGASTFATNLAWELAQVTKGAPPSVCLIDFDLQFGSIACLLDLQPRAAVIDLFTDTEDMDEGSLLGAMHKVSDTLMVLTPPEDLLPLDMLTPADVQRIVDLAQRQFDFVVIDMPHCIVDWTEVVLKASTLYFAMLETNMVSAQNCVRFRRALTAEDLPTEHLRFVLNRAPKFTDLNGRARVKRMCDSLDISLELQLPDGGKPVMQSNDQGEALARSQAKNPLRKEIVKLAQKIHATAQSPASET